MVTPGISKRGVLCKCDSRLIMLLLKRDNFDFTSAVILLFVKF